MRDVGQDYTGIGVSDLIVDNIFIQAFAKPGQAYVVATPHRAWSLLIQH